MVEMSVFYHNVLTYPGRQFDDAIRKNLQLCVTGGAAFPETWYEAFLERFGVPILPGYGATETTTCVSWCLERDGYVRGKVGRPVPGVKVRILAEDGSIRPVGAEGEIVVSSPGVMKGYFDLPVETARVLHDGWYRTGDLGLIDTDGQLVIMGRLDDKIMSGYYRIDPTAVESMICSHPQVSLAAVVGVPDEVLGERAKAFIVMNPGTTPDPEGLRHWLADRLPEWMVPELMEFLPSLPLTATGKVARAALRSV
jgi:long-chain acyl-CoA synthetase